MPDKASDSRSTILIIDLQNSNVQYKIVEDALGRYEYECDLMVYRDLDQGLSVIGCLRLDLAVVIVDRLSQSEVAKIRAAFENEPVAMIILSNELSGDLAEFVKCYDERVLHRNLRDLSTNINRMLHLVEDILGDSKM